jgi:hydroxyacylglutathione hydrolase
LEKQIEKWAGTLVKYSDAIILVVAEHKEKEAIIRLARIGYDNVLGYLDGGI